MRKRFASALPSLSSLFALSLALFLCAGAAWAKPLTLALGVSIDIPDDWEVSSAALPGAKLQMGKPTELLLAAREKDDVVTFMSLNVDASGAEIAWVMRGGEKTLTIFRERYGAKLKEAYEARGSEFFGLYGLAVERFSERPSLFLGYGLKMPSGITTSAMRILTPVGDTLYDFAFIYTPEESDEALNILAPVIRSIKIAAQPGETAPQMDARPGTPGAKPYTRPDAAPVAPAAPGGASVPGAKADDAPGGAGMHDRLNRLRQLARDVAN